MTDKTFILTLEEVKEIYRAGIARGHDEEASFQCGSRTVGKEFDNCVNTLYDMLNEGKKWDSDDWIHLEEIESWFR